MKFSTVLGTFALSTLEAYSALASPVGPEAQSLESRGTEYCCVQTEIKYDRKTAFVGYPVPGLQAVVASSGDCKIIVTETNTPPSQGGCATWTFESKGCSSDQRFGASVLPAEYCQAQ
ncbi:hypothetical protein E4U24_007575 [Claviceps purpurea]|nr:hypothetical protein E4U28_007485 [Claviceps purpurea]KAG6237082.1 hypothetical protein E4U24_007575 [Claviceps purpurea]KAG6283559.1 hypothetical protein E4U46_007684 [Claviceps purpurea]